MGTCPERRLRHLNEGVYIRTEITRPHLVIRPVTPLRLQPIKPIITLRSDITPLKTHIVQAAIYFRYIHTK